MVKFWSESHRPGIVLYRSVLFLFIWMITVGESTLTTTDSLEYLVKFGYLTEQDSKLGALRTEESFKQALIQFQKMAGIPVTGKFDNATKEMMEVPRCGNKDNIQLGAEVRRKRYALHGSKWPKRELTFKISDFPRSMSSDSAEKEVYNALKVWTDVTPLKFILRRFNERVDIDVRFARRHHGDGNPFDGRGRTLAHAFFPQFGGDVHFDDDEDWTVNISTGVNMLQVAAHEFGHSLGLSHSDVSTAIMAPFYRGFKRDFRLDPDDIGAIQELYGHFKKQEIEKMKPTRPHTRGPILTIPKICTDSKIDAMTMNSDGYTYIFRGTQYYRLNSYGIDEGYPKEIDLDWKGITGPIDSALHWDNGYTYIFKGHYYWKFYNFKLIYVRSISEGFKGIPGNIDASFVWGGNGKTYFIKGDQYWRYTVNHVDPGYPKAMSVWVGLPSHIDAALKWKNGRTYFFSGDLYYRYNDVDFRVDKSYPRSTASWWLGCPDKQQMNQIAASMADTGDHSKESDNTVSQSQNRTKLNQSEDHRHNEEDASSDQFLQMKTAGEAGTVDFFHDDGTSAENTSLRCTFNITFMLIVIVTAIIFRNM